MMAPAWCTLAILDWMRWPRQLRRCGSDGMGMRHGCAHWLAWQAYAILNALLHNNTLKITLRNFLNSYQVKNPARDIPMGILGAVGITTLCYMLMTAALVLMVPIGSMDVNAAFASAFGSVGMEWARCEVQRVCSHLCMGWVKVQSYNLAIAAAILGYALSLCPPTSVCQAPVDM